MEYEQQITQLKGTLAVMVEIQQQQADVQKMQAHTLLVHERLQARQAESLAIHERRMNDFDTRMVELQKMLGEGLARHEQQMNKLREGYALHEQRMSHIDMRLAEITDKLDGMIGFMDGFTRRPQ
jgi:chromosome segregation ATPase